MKRSTVRATFSLALSAACAATAATPVPAGKATIRYEFAYDGGGFGKGGLGTIFVNGKKVAEGRVGQTQPFGFSADEGATSVEMERRRSLRTIGIPAPINSPARLIKSPLT